MYDVQLYFAIMLKDEGRAGVLLNFKDIDNYYQIEFSSTGIRFGMMFEGRYSHLKELDMTLLIDQWY